MIKRKMLLLCLACGIAAGCDRTGDAATENAAVTGNDAAAQKAAQASGTIGDALAGSADHSAFLQALQSTGLIETLKGAGPYTVFAPTNAAFDALPADVRSGLNAPERRERLVSLLSFHIVPGTVTAADLGRAVDHGEGGRAEIATVTGDNLSVSREGDALVVRDAAGGQARITAADQIRSNGVIHSIDAVLMPGN